MYEIIYNLVDNRHRFEVAAPLNRLEELAVRAGTAFDFQLQNRVHGNYTPWIYNARVTPYRSVSSASRSSAGRASPGALLGRRTVAMLAPASSIR